MNLKQTITASAAALMIAGSVALSIPAQAASNPLPAPVAADPSTYAPILVTETADSNIYYGPSQDEMITATSNVYAGENWYVLGQDPTGQWVELYVTSTVSVWVPKAVMALNATTPLPIINS